MGHPRLILPDRTRRTGRLGMMVGLALLSLVLLLLAASSGAPVEAYSLVGE